MTLENKTLLVTGGESGIGAAIVARFLSEGATVISADISVTADTLQDVGDRHYRMSVDVTDEASVHTLFKAVGAQTGPVDGVVNSAGIGHDVPFLDTPLELFDRILAINLRGTFLIGREAARHMKEQASGSIVNLASVSGLKANKGRAAYGASKAGVILMSQIMAVELAEHGIRVNVIAPGPIDTPMVQEMHDRETRAQWISTTPMGRYGSPEDIAGAAVFLTGPDAGYVNGHVMVVDGGFTPSGIMPGSK